VRLRLRFAKTGKIRWTSHRDLARIWERVIRRAGLPIAYSQGFSPHPKLHFGLALSTGHESVAEFLDLDLRADAELPTPEDLAALPARLTPLLPIGIEVTAVAEIPSSSTSLQEAVTSCEWSIELRGVTPEVAAPAVERLLGADELIITRQRKGKDVTDDARPYLLHLAVVGPTDAGTELAAELATRPRGLRSSELLELLDLGATEGRVRRLTQWMLLDGTRTEPLAVPAGATSAPPHTELCAT